MSSNAVAVQLDEFGHDLAVDEIDALILNSIKKFIFRADFSEMQNSLENKGFAVLRGLLDANLFAAVEAECNALLNRHGKSRDFVMKQTANTPRKMVNVKRDDIHKYGRVIPQIYHSEWVRSVFGMIARETFSTVPYTPEEYIVNALYKSGDTHGWHWDDYRYGIVFAIETPALENGGFVQVVPNTHWNRANPSVEENLFRNPIHSFRLEPGDAYILRSDTGLHRVHPITEGSKRVIVNMVWAAADELSKDVSHDTMEALFE
ncbi:phytanoyl-CoA dioxygenase family protein [Allorhizobium sp. BGMRC 0089]|uniref:HalD/BesD family halogenase n=1 Tax=Allorhizobium sonneratiae TaxID=2934936 RepID=UPI002033CE36|nr:phytanoyl-CoA dioxygenase family protein [Allorhizobium sonneratiae]MCM2292965.1 phytanoyl-CoA dioxygenase family protein [Allorhizobium sonneratiae]